MTGSQDDFSSILRAGGGKGSLGSQNIASGRRRPHTTPGSQRPAAKNDTTRLGMETAMEPVSMVPLRTGVELAVSVEAGQPPALVFLHGGLGNRFNWRSQFDFARARGWQALAYDLGGHGGSSPYPRYGIGRHRRDLTRLLAHLAITGGRDPSFNFARGETLCSHFQRAKHLHIPAAGHIVMAEYPEAVNAAIAEWREDTAMRAWADLMPLA